MTRERCGKKGAGLTGYLRDTTGYTVVGSEFDFASDVLLIERCHSQSFDQTLWIDLPLFVSFLSLHTVCDVAFGLLRTCHTSPARSRNLLLFGYVAKSYWRKISSAPRS